ncbi:MAG TPA: hypothetical protein VI336_02090 [Candidatus Saccharimonadales bacterium]|nr:hypothetical protein [Candidatus Saccharimonadales bacterium]
METLFKLEVSMGVLLEDQPTLTDLHTLISKVPGYPITAKRVVELAEKQKTPKPVVDFYRAFPKSEIFEDKDDLLSRTENLEILHHQTAPREEMHAPEED